LNFLSFDRRFVDTGDLVIQRQSRSSLARSLALVATPAYNEKPAASPTVLGDGLSDLSGDYFEFSDGMTALKYGQVSKIFSESVYVAWSRLSREMDLA